MPSHEKRSFLPFPAPSAPERERNIGRFRRAFTAGLPRPSRLHLEAAALAVLMLWAGVEGVRFISATAQIVLAI